MHTRTTPSDDAFREEVRDFLITSLSDELREAGRKKPAFGRSQYPLRHSKKFFTTKVGSLPIGQRRMAVPIGH